MVGSGQEGGVSGEFHDITDTELLNRIESGLFNDRYDYVHIYTNEGTFIVEIDGKWGLGATLRAALEKLLQQS